VRSVVASIALPSSTHETAAIRTLLTPSVSHGAHLKPMFLGVVSPALI
jgi:hypothetical protein